MKRAIVITEYALMLLISFNPLCALLCFCFGYEIKLANPIGYAVFVAVTAVCETILCVHTKEASRGRCKGILFTMLFPVSVFTEAILWFETDELKSGIIVAVCMLICSGCCFYLTVRFGRPRVFKILITVLFSLIAVFFCILSPILLFAGSIGQNTVVQSVDSPNGAYRAEVIDSNQGALGGDTLVDVYNNKEMNLLVLRIRKKPQRVYQGEWGEFNDMELQWKNEHCLIVSFPDNNRQTEYNIG